MGRLRKEGGALGLVGGGWGAYEARLRGTASHVLKLEAEVGAGGSGEWKA